MKPKKSFSSFYFVIVIPKKHLSTEILEGNKIEFVHVAQNLKFKCDTECLYRVLLEFCGVLWHHTKKNTNPKILEFSIIFQLSSSRMNE